MGKISIIVPIYNAEQYLPRCINSILSQSFADFELLLINDGSIDGSGAICDAYAEKDDRIRVFHKENEGSAATRQYGFVLANGEYIAAVDADDWVDSNYLESMINVLEKDNSDIVVSAYWKNDNGKDSLVENKPQGHDVIAWQKSFLGNRCHAGLWNKLLRKSLLCSSDVLVPKFDFYDDMVVTISYLQQCQKLSYCPTASYHYCLNDNSQTYEKDVNKRIRRLEDMLNNMQILYFSLSSADRIELIQEFNNCVNAEKIKIIENYSSCFNVYKHLVVEKFPHSYPINKIKGITTMCRYFALKGFVLPIRLLILAKKKCHAKTPNHTQLV